MTVIELLGYIHVDLMHFSFTVQRRISPIATSSDLNNCNKISRVLSIALHEILHGLAL